VSATSPKTVYLAGVVSPFRTNTRKIQTARQHITYRHLLITSNLIYLLKYNLHTLSLRFLGFCVSSLFEPRTALGHKKVRQGSSFRFDPAGNATRGKIAAVIILIITSNRSTSIGWSANFQISSANWETA
jgi:hypothetical protein